jgi:hypothetical protein
MSNRIELSATLNVQAADEAATPTFELVAYTGASIRQGWSRNPLVVDLAQIDASRPIPILYAHGKELPLLDSVIGKSLEATNDGSQLLLRGELIRGTPASDKLIALAKAGVPLQASIGADVGSIENIAAGASVTVNGREFPGPISVSRGAVLRETSVVLFGADSQTSAAIAAEASEVFPMSDTLNEKPVEAAVPSTEATAIVAGGPTPAVQLGADDIAKIVAEAAEKAVKAYREETLAEVRASRPSAPAVHVVNAADANSPKVVEAALCLAGGLPNVEKVFDTKTLEAADRRRNHTSLQEVLLEAARANGYSGVQKIHEGNIEQVLAGAFPRVTASGFATHSISNVLAATYGKFLLQGYTAVESVWDRIASVRSVSDYKTVTGVRLNGGFAFEDVGATGELKSADASDETRTIRAKLTGRISSITMVDIVNDDLGALTQVPSRLGRGAAVKLNADFWTEFLLNNASAFRAESPGAGNALSTTSLRTALASYRKLTDPDGLPLGVTPSIILLPPELEMVGEELMGSSVLITGENTTRGNVNVFAGRFQVVSSAYLTSATTWWLVANPAELPCMEVAFLNGQRTPTVQQADADFNQLGIQVRGHFSYGVAKAETRGAYRMATS